MLSKAVTFSQLTWNLSRKNHQKVSYKWSLNVHEVNVGWRQRKNVMADQDLVLIQWTCTKGKFIGGQTVKICQLVLIKQKNFWLEQPLFNGLAYSMYMYCEKVDLSIRAIYTLQVTENQQCLRASPAGRLTICSPYISISWHGGQPYDTIQSFIYPRVV